VPTLPQYVIISASSGIPLFFKRFFILSFALKIFPSVASVLYGMLIEPGICCSKKLSLSLLSIKITLFFSFAFSKYSAVAIISGFKLSECFAGRIFGFSVFVLRPSSFHCE
jgi:hypothetical protein